MISNDNILHKYFDITEAEPGLFITLNEGKENESIRYYSGYSCVGKERFALCQIFNKTKVKTKNVWKKICEQIPIYNKSVDKSLKTLESLKSTIKLTVTLKNFETTFLNLTKMHKSFEYILKFLTCIFGKKAFISPPPEKMSLLTDMYKRDKELGLTGGKSFYEYFGLIPRIEDKEAKKIMDDVWKDEIK